MMSRSTTRASPGSAGGGDPRVLHRGLAPRPDAGREAAVHRRRTPFRTRAGASRRRFSPREPARGSCTTRGGRSATTRLTRATATFIYATEEEFAGGAFPNGCANDGPLFISSLEGSYNGEGWRSTPTEQVPSEDDRHLAPVRQGRVVDVHGLLGPLLPDRGPHPLDVVLQPGVAVPRHHRPDRPDRDRLFPAGHGHVGEASATGASTTPPIGTASTSSG